MDFLHIFFMEDEHMYTKQQIVQGTVAYLMQEMANNGCDDLRKWAIPFAGEFYIAKYLDQMDPILKDMNLMSEDGLVDVDSLYNRLIRIAEEQGAITVELPVVKRMKLSQEDVMRVYNCIRGM